MDRWTRPRRSRPATVRDDAENPGSWITCPGAGWSLRAGATECRASPGPSGRWAQLRAGRWLELIPPIPDADPSGRRSSQAGDRYAIARRSVVRVRRGGTVQAAGGAREPSDPRRPDRPGAASTSDGREATSASIAINEGAEPGTAPLLNVRQMRQSTWRCNGGQVVLAWSSTWEYRYNDSAAVRASAIGPPPHSSACSPSNTNASARGTRFLGDAGMLGSWRKIMWLVYPAASAPVQPRVGHRLAQIAVRKAARTRRASAKAGIRVKMTSGMFLSPLPGGILGRP